MYFGLVTNNTGPRRLICDVVSSPILLGTFKYRRWEKEASYVMSEYISGIRCTHPFRGGIIYSEQYCGFVIRHSRTASKHVLCPVERIEMIRQATSDMNAFKHRPAVICDRCCRIVTGRQDASSMTIKPGAVSVSRPVQLAVRDNGVLHCTIL